jgi:hypothetical protein
MHEPLTLTRWMHEPLTPSSSSRLERVQTASSRFRVSKDGNRAAPKATSLRLPLTRVGATGQTRVQATHDKACLEQTLEHEAARSASLLSQVSLEPHAPDRHSHSRHPLDTGTHTHALRHSRRHQRLMARCVQTVLARTVHPPSPHLQTTQQDHTCNVKYFL